ncbi:MAG: AAA family ATPase [Planctomycetaceae bacterium]|nr:AAA family ATPase [Planctomycetaceae bacterium]
MSAHAPTDALSAMEAAEQFRTRAGELRSAIERCVVGLGASLEECLWCLLADGHLLLEGVPGLGKTLLVRTIAQAAGLHAGRVQCTPDLMPSDIIGTAVLLDDPATGQRVRRFRAGPIFCQVLLVDEINRAAPRSQSALLEAMQERSVSVDGHTHQLSRPFLVLATQNPIEQEGTYPLPEAQLDRFLAKIEVPMPDREALGEILRRTTIGAMPEVPQVIDAEGLQALQRLARQVAVAPHVQDWAIRLTLSTQAVGAFAAPSTARWIRHGAGPRAAQAMLSLGKVRALLAGRYALAIDDLRAVASMALRHRLQLCYEAEADGMRANEVVAHLVSSLPLEAP